MNFQALRQLAVARARPEARTFGSLLLLLLASALLQDLVRGSVGSVSSLMPGTLDPQLVGAVVSATLGVALLGGVYAVARYRWEPGLDGDDLFTLGGVAGLLFLVVAYRLHGGMDLPVFPGTVVSSFLIGVVALGVPALVYARVEGIDVQFGLPERDDVPIAGATVLIAALAGVVSIIAFAATAPTLPLYPLDGPQLSAGLVAWNIVLPGALVGLGWGILYNGAVQERLRDRIGPTSAVAAVTALVASYVLWPLGAAGQNPDAVTTAVTTTIGVLFALLIAALAVWATQRLPRAIDIDPTPLVGAATAGLVVALALLAVAVVGPIPANATILTSVLGFTVVAAAAAIGYERSRSVWVPAVAFVVYFILVDANLLWYLAQRFMRLRGDYFVPPEVVGLLG